MRWGRWFGSVLAWSAACSSDAGAPPAADTSMDAGSASDATLPDASVDAGPVRAPFGLDTRPENRTCIAPARPASAAPVSFERFFANVSIGLPMTMAQIPGDPTRWFLATLYGQILGFPADNPPDAPSVALDLSKLTSFPAVVGSEDGLLGIAFHPHFADNGQLFVIYTTPGGPSGYRSLVARFTSTDGGATFGGFTPILGPFDQPTGTHVGGGIAFGNDGYLYLSFGDGDDSSNGQRTDSYFGKILRIDVDSSPAPGLAYAIPEGNPFKNGGGEPATFARGLRNPFRFSIDRGTGDVWVGDVGNGAWEEIDVVRAGGNYGWPCREGAHVFDTTPARCPSTQGLIDPLFEYPHTTAEPLKAIMGGVVYRGKAIPSLVGTYIFGDYEASAIWGLSFDPTSGSPVVAQLNPSGPSANWVAFAEDVDGEVYAISHTGNAVYKIVPSGASPPSTFPDRLSKTGCVDPTAPTRPSPGAIPYAVNAALWSDGANKDRVFAIPDGKAIHVGADGDFDLPIGSVVLKSFSLGGKHIETRMLVHHDDGEWAGYTYEWLDDESDAVLLPAGKSKAVGTQTWSYPSRSGCIQCHTVASGRTLGLELGQLNRDFTYAATHRISNQLATLEHVGFFDAPLGAPADALVAYPDPLGSPPLESRARAYLHANCSMCHRPGAPSPAGIDLRFSTSLHDAGVCNVIPQVDDLGVPDATLLSPGVPATSILSVRAHVTGASRMPPLGSAIVDGSGLSVIDAWIRSIAACP